jgi:ssRNA-specific RNase YbeY (16S rRNA maturation enzyme)
MGFSHDKENEALIMEGIEVKILKDLGIPNPYEGVI